MSLPHITPIVVDDVLDSLVMEHEPSTAIVCPVWLDLDTNPRATAYVDKWLLDSYEADLNNDIGFHIKGDS